VNKKLSYRWQTAWCCFVNLLRYCRTFVRLELCGYPMVKKFPRYVCSFWHDPRTWQTDGQTGRRMNRQTPHDSIDRACIASRGKNAWQHVPVYLQQFPSYSNQNCKKIVIFTYLGLHFLFALGTPLWQSRKTLHEWKDNLVLAKLLAACTHLSSTVSHFFELQMQKNRRFHVPQPTFLFSLETPLRQSR